MKATEIRFFDQAENEEATPKKKAKKTAAPTGYISPIGKLVLPNKTVDQLGLDLDNAMFKVGAQAGKRKLKHLFLLPAQSADSSTFKMEKAAKSYSISLAIILQRGGIDFANHKYTFTVEAIDYQGESGYSLKLGKHTAKAAKPTTTRAAGPRTGKVGRPRKTATVE